jgi:hypothetical protein
VSDQHAAVELVVNPATRIVHVATCFYAGIMQLNDPLPLERWPEAERDQLRGCGNCEPPGWR